MEIDDYSRTRRRWGKNGKDAAHFIGDELVAHANLL